MTTHDIHPQCAGAQCAAGTVVQCSAEEQAVLSMYRLRCSSHMVKPVDFEQFARVIRALGSFGFTVVVLPGA